MDYGISKKIDPADGRQSFWSEQRSVRGFDDTETWGLYFTIAKFILPRLILFKEKNCGYPISLTSDEWDDIIDQMIYAFDQIANVDEDKIDYDKIEVGLNLFAKWYLDLWW